MISPEISVIIPVYNVGAYLPRCLESLMDQTFSQIEILCIDDGSTDNTLQTVQKYREADPRIRLLTQPHRGVSAARNLGLQSAEGTYVVFLDADDWVEPDMLETLLLRAKETGCDVAVCSSEVHFEQKSLRNLRRRRSLQAALTCPDLIWSRENPDHCVWQLMAAPGVWPFVWNKLIRRTLLTENSIAFSPELALGEDGVFLHLLFRYAQKVVLLPQMLHHYRYQRKDSATDRLFLDPFTRFGQHLDVAEVMLREFQTRNLLAGSEEGLLRWLLEFLYSDFIGLPASQRQSAAGSIRQLLMLYELMGFGRDLGKVRCKRLQIMTDPERPCTPVQRSADILFLKIQNRLMRLLPDYCFE